MNLQVVYFQRCKCAFHQHQVWMKLQLAIRLLLLRILQLYHLSPLPPPVSNSSCLFTWCWPVCQLLYYTIALFNVPYCKILNVLFFVFFVCVYYLYEKYYKPITAQYYIANCVSWVPRLTLLDLTNKLDLRMCSRNRTRMYVGDLLYTGELCSLYANTTPFYIRNLSIWGF